jgi:hypothetical protein
MVGTSQMNLPLLIFAAAAAAAPFVAHLGDKREKIENELGYPFTEGTVQIAGQPVAIARYPFEDKVTISAYFAKGTCVALRFSSSGETSEEAAGKLLQRYGGPAASWKIVWRRAEGGATDKEHGTDSLTRFESSAGERPQVAVLTQTTKTVRQKVEVKEWNILVYDDRSREITVALERSKL